MSILKAKIASKLNKNPFPLSEASSHGFIEGVKQENEQGEDGDHESQNMKASLKKAPKVGCGLQSPNNIMKNYGRAISNFILSSLAIPYLTPLLQKNQITVETFRRFVHSRKNKLNCIKRIREMLHVAPGDSAEMSGLKSIFQETTIIFLKFFTPNWLYNSLRY